MKMNCVWFHFSWKEERSFNRPAKLWISQKGVHLIYMAVNLWIQMCFIFSITSFTLVELWRKRNSIWISYAYMENRKTRIEIETQEKILSCCWSGSPTRWSFSVNYMQTSCLKFVKNPQRCACVVPRAGFKTRFNTRSSRLDTETMV